MFISQKDADKRLNSRQNRLREESAPEIPETVDVPEVGHAVDDDDEKGGGLEIPGGLSALDSLITPRPLVKYKGNTDAQAAIAETSLIIGQHQAAALFGLSQEQTLAYERGLQTTKQITTGERPDTALRARVHAIRERLAAKASDRLADCLDLLNTDKLKTVKRATNLSRIAKDMATIVEKVTPKESVEGNAVHFHIWKPEMNIEQNYKTVTIGSKE